MILSSIKSRDYSLSLIIALAQMVQSDMGNLAAMLEFELSKQIVCSTLAHFIARILVNYHQGIIFAYCLTPLGCEKVLIWRAVCVSLSDTPFQQEIVQFLNAISNTHRVSSLGY
jgi:hypothetical protein